MKNYKDLFVWQRGHAFVLDVYRVTKNFPKEELYGITSQLRRAAVSVPTNVAEGSGKFTQRDFANYLQNSLGSCMESEYLIFLSFELGYMRVEEFKNLDEQVNEVKAKLINFLVKVRGDEDKKVEKAKKNS